MPRLPFMIILEQLRRLLRPGAGEEPGEPSARVFELDQNLAEQLQDMADLTSRPRDELANELLLAALHRRQVSAELIQRWQGLSEREQQVAALACLGHTNREIATRLNISPETVKTHLRNVLYKFTLSNRNDLRLILAEWDFSGWEDA